MNFGQQTASHSTFIDLLLAYCCYITKKASKQIAVAVDERRRQKLKKREENISQFCIYLLLQTTQLYKLFLLAQSTGIADDELQL